MYSDLARGITPADIKDLCVVDYPDRHLSKVSKLPKMFFLLRVVCFFLKSNERFVGVFFSVV